MKQPADTDGTLGGSGPRTFTPQLPSVTVDPLPGVCSLQDDAGQVQGAGVKGAGLPGLVAYKHT